jgi:hypothetical protein
VSAAVRALAASGALAVGFAAVAPTSAQTPAAARPLCVHTLVAMSDTVDSSKARSGDVFQFVSTETVKAPDGTVVPSGTVGYGIVANASHAERGGRGGYLALETRFFVLDDGKHVPAIIDRANDQASTAAGATANAPGILGMIPIVGYAVGGYDSLHHGKDATIPKGTRVGIFLGDDAALGTCRALAAGESPPPATPAPAAPAPTPGTTPPGPPQSSPTPSPTVSPAA